MVLRTLFIILNALLFLGSSAEAVVAKPRKQLFDDNNRLRY